MKNERLKIMLHFKEYKINYINNFNYVDCFNIHAIY